MADAENATRAPESDAQEDAAPAAPAPVASTGEIIKLNDVDVYISKPVDYPHAPSRLLLLLTGGTGIKSTNNQIQADKYAAEGFLVLMPDMFGGDSAPAGTAIADDSTSFLEQLKIKAVEVTKSFLIDMWLARVTEERVLPILHKVIDAAKEQYADAIKQGDGIYAVGYCVGARFVLLLAKKTQAAGEDEESGGVKTGPFIKAGALAHAASVVPDDFLNLSVPLSLVCVENDPLFPDSVRMAGEDSMSLASLEHEVSVYPGVPHGFAVVGEYQDNSIKDAQATAYEQMLQWIQTH
ncbi:hypothetical protein G7Z17_g13612 [Cylindrodendrum hubeiense]|uniref:Dienelactone hydrolase domain-containing protein n=1 Tax=Cylindrodendrum hubeiense TaxID=595255 RepID=A0A9P5L246_9HYPO|nr:hypothetical protein G7Z17_g13612 [Cylindrodendrum hubeiense]